MCDTHVRVIVHLILQGSNCSLGMVQIAQHFVLAYSNAFRSYFLLVNWWFNMHLLLKVYICICAAEK